MFVNIINFIYNYISVWNSKAWTKREYIHRSKSYSSEACLNKRFSKSK